MKPFVFARTESGAAVDAFVRDIGSTPVYDAFNPWADSDSTDVFEPGWEGRQVRLFAHLACYPRLVLVGEAPGYQGCRYSGVPFTSERLILEGQVPRVNIDETLYERITTRDKPWSEPSATIVWKALHAYGLAESTVMWNAFPFHPHRPGVIHSNATPTVEQLLAGREWLVKFLALPNLAGATVLPVGKKAAAMLEGIAPKPPVVLRHPANGGARLFSEGLGAYALYEADRRFGQPHYGDS